MTSKRYTYYPRSFGTVLALCASTFLSVFSLQADAINEGYKEKAKQLQSSLHQLAQQRKTVAAEKLPLSRKLQALEVEVKALREQAVQIQRRRDSMTTDLQSLQRKVHSQEKSYHYVTHSLFTEYISAWDASLPNGRRSSTGETTRKHYLLLDQKGAGDQAALESSLNLIHTSIRQIQDAIGGNSYQGKVIDNTAYIHEARFIQTGPIVHAQYMDKSIAGISYDDGSVHPRISPYTSSHIVDFFENGSATMPINTDPDALKAKLESDGLVAHIQKGGIWVYPILLFALLSTIAAILKSLQIFRIREIELKEVKAIAQSIREADTTKAQAQIQNHTEPMRRLLETAAESATESIEFTEEAMYTVILQEQPKLERHQSIIAISAATAPLLGLLGTVTGIIKTFEAMAYFGSNNSKPLISGISEALITTELGLILAIPALILHALFSRKTAKLLAHMEKVTLVTLNELSRSKPQNNASD